MQTATNTKAAFEAVYRFGQCEVTLWKDGTVRIAGPLQVGIDGAYGTVAACRPQALLSHTQDCLLQLISGGDSDRSHFKLCVCHETVAGETL